MLTGLLPALRREYRSLLTTTVCAAVIAAAGVVALLFTAVAIFLAVSDAYGRVEACLAMAAFFAAVALIVAIALLVMQAHRQKLAAKTLEGPKERPAWLDPALIPVGLEAAKLVVRNRGLLYILLGSAAIGWLMTHSTEANANEPAAEPAE